MRPGHAIEVRKEAADFRLLPGDLAQRAAFGPGAGRRESQERAAARSGLLQPAYAAQRVASVRDEHGLKAVAQERLHRPLVGRVGLERIGDHPEDVDSLGPGEQRPHAFVEGGVRGHHLLERGEASGEAVALALHGVGFPGPRLGANAGRRGPQRGLLALADEPVEERLGLLPAGPGPVTDAAHARPFALQLFALGHELPEVGLGPLRADRDRGLCVLQRGHPAEERDLSLA